MLIAICFVQGIGSYYAWPERAQVCDLCSCLYRNYLRGLYCLIYFSRISIIDNSGRYNDFAKQLNANGYKVYGMDWIGKSKNHLYMLTIEFLPLYKPRLSVCAYLKMLSTVLGH